MLSKLKSEKQTYRDQVRHLLARQCTACYADGRYASPALLGAGSLVGDAGSWLTGLGPDGRLAFAGHSPSGDTSTVTTRLSSPADSMCVADIEGRDCGVDMDDDDDADDEFRSQRLKCCSSPALNAGSKRHPVCPRTRSAESLAAGCASHLSPASSLTLLLANFPDDEHPPTPRKANKHLPFKYAKYNLPRRFAKRNDDCTSSKVNFIMHI